jgi:hypothetical protein
MMPPAPAEAGDLEAYVFHNYEDLFSDAERIAWRTIAEGRPCGPEATISQMLREGEIAFYRATTARIMKDYEREVALNRCPKCGTLCRTPQACVCPNSTCNHTWFEKRRQEQNKSCEATGDNVSS